MPQSEHVPIALHARTQVARQLATVAGLGRRRPKPKKQEKPKLGQEGEDIVTNETGKPAHSWKTDCSSAGSHAQAVFPCHVPHPRRHPKGALQLGRCTG